MPGGLPYHALRIMMPFTQAPIGASASPNLINGKTENMLDILRRSAGGVVGLEAGHVLLRLLPSQALRNRRRARLWRHGIRLRDVGAPLRRKARVCRVPQGDPGYARGA